MGVMIMRCYYECTLDGTDDACQRTRLPCHLDLDSGRHVPHTMANSRTWCAYVSFAPGSSARVAVLRKPRTRRERPLKFRGFPLDLERLDETSARCAAPRRR